MIDLETTKQQLLEKLATLKVPTDILKASELKQLYAEIPKLPADQRSAYGQAVNALKVELEELISKNQDLRSKISLNPIDVTAPMDVNASVPALLPSEQGTVHPISREIAYMSDILQQMGFQVFESREIDDQYHMFESLNFPKGHPARDEWDTFMTVETDKDGDQFIAPAHTSTMQNRIMSELKPKLDDGEAIAAVAIDRCFRNEDLDARHEHTFYQHEGIYVGKNVHAGMLVATLKSFLEAYFETEIDARVNPFYFPFTEPSFEFSLSCPFCMKQGCGVCSQSGWIELLGCGMIHPNVLKMAGIDPTIYTGFAWGGGVDRLIMMKHNIEDIRHLESGKLDFLRQF